MRPVESQEVQFAAVDHHQLGVVTDQIVRCAGYRNSGGEQAQFKLSQILFSRPIGMRDQRVHGNSARDCVPQRLFDFFLIEAEDHDFDGF